jgi:hypothetical protein
MIELRVQESEPGFDKLWVLLDDLRIELLGFSEQRSGFVDLAL